MFERIRNWFRGKQTQTERPGRGHTTASNQVWNDLNSQWRAAGYLPNYPGWNPVNRDADSAIAAEWYTLTARIRQQVENAPQLKKARSILTRLTMGRGITTFASARVGNELDEEFNQEADYWWKQWCKQEADYRREQTLHELLRTCYNDLVTVGNAILIERVNPNNTIVPLCYEAIEWEQVFREFDKPGNPDGGLRIENGIEYDASRRKKRYYFYAGHPQNSLTQTSELVSYPVNRIIHLYLPTRISGNSGISWFTAAMLPAKDTDWYLGNELTASAIAALMTIIHKTDGDLSSGTSTCGDANYLSGGVGQSNGSSSPTVNIGSAVYSRIPREDDIEIAESKRPNASCEPFLNQFKELGAQATGLSLQRWTGDASRANFASIKAAFEDDQSLIGPLQDYMINHAYDPIRGRFTEMAVAAGIIQSISMSQFRAAPYRWKAIEAIPPAPVSSEPLKQVEAAREACKSGFTTPQREAARLYGMHPREVIAETAEWNKACEDAGVVFDYSKGQGGQVERNTTERPEESELEESSDGATQEGN